MTNQPDKDRRGTEGAEREPFLARWSKRKTELRNTARQQPTPPAPEPGDTLADKPFDPQAFELPIPDLDSIVAGFDMRPFLQKGVPESLKNAALRKLWVTDPAIAGFVSPALDYAFDYNTPGAAPGFGPLIGDQDLTNLMQNLFSRDPKAPEPPPESAPLIAPAAQAETLVAVPEGPAQTTLEQVETAAPLLDSDNKNNAVADPSIQNEQYPKKLDEVQNTEPPRPIRHGSALPQ